MKAMIKLFLPWLCLWSVSWTARGQWTSEAYVLRPGWNAIYALNDCSHVTFDALLAAYPDVMSVWRWEPSNLTSQFIGNPTEPVAGQEWKTWVRGEPQNSTMTAMLPNFAYLIYCREEKSVPSEITLNLTGEAVVTRLEWRSSGSNLLGFPSKGSPQPTFGSTTVGYLAPLAGLGYNPASTGIYHYVGGKLGDKNPKQVLSLTQAGITRGEAYWIDLPIHSDFVSPIQLTLSDVDGFHFGKLGTTKRLRVTNLGNAAATITVTPTPSLAAPAGESVISGDVPLLLRVWNQSAERFEYEPITGPLTASLASKASAEWVVIPDRSAMGGTVGSLYASILRITDSTNYADLTVPVSAEVAGLSGLWVGTAAITNVANELNRFERDTNGETIYDEQGNPIPLPLDTMGSATAQPFSLRLIVHVNAQGEARLLSNVYYGLLDSGTIGFAARQARLNSETLADAVRISAAHLPLDVNAPFSPEALALGGSYQVQVVLPHDDPTNPFVHTYHPDHDNLDVRFNADFPLPSGVESYTVTRTISLGLDATNPGTDPTWGNRTLTGTYAEIINGLHKNALEVSGRFELRRVSQIAGALAE